MHILCNTEKFHNAYICVAFKLVPTIDSSHNVVNNITEPVNRSL
jgi:hypothetical protein